MTADNIASGWRTITDPRIPKGIVLIRGARAVWSIPTQETTP